jgi:hypothetical protein
MSLLDARWTFMLLRISGALAVIGGLTWLAKGVWWCTLPIERVFPNPGACCPAGQGFNLGSQAIFRIRRRECGHRRSMFS